MASCDKKAMASCDKKAKFDMKNVIMKFDHAPLFVEVTTFEGPKGEANDIIKSAIQNIFSF